MPRPIRIATRAIIINDNKLLLVNAWQSGSDLMCAPGGGADPHASLPDNLKREIWEETGLTVDVGPVCLINEFHAPDRDFHQVDVYFRCTIVAGQTDINWRDTEGVVDRFKWVTRDALRTLHHKPDSLGDVAWAQDGAITYDALEPLIR